MADLEGIPIEADRNQIIYPEDLAYTLDEFTSLARGLMRTTIIGRRQNGLPITAEGQRLDKILQHLKAEQGE